MEDKQMGFYLMLASMLLGLLALKIGFSQFKEKKDTFLSIGVNRFTGEFWYVGQENWLEEMTKIELAVCDLKPYKDISFLQHVWLMKE